MGLLTFQNSRLQSRYGKSPLVAVVVLASVGLITGIFVSQFIRETSFSYVKVEAVEFSYIYSEIVEDIENSRWKITFGLINKGTETVQVSRVFLNQRTVDHYDLHSLDFLENGFSTGTKRPG